MTRLCCCTVLKGIIIFHRISKHILYHRPLGMKVNQFWSSIVNLHGTFYIRILRHLAVQLGRLSLLVYRSWTVDVVFYGSWHAQKCWLIVLLFQLWLPTQLSDLYFILGGRLGSMTFKIISASIWTSKLQPSRICYYDNPTRFRGG